MAKQNVDVEQLLSLVATLSTQIASLQQQQQQQTQKPSASLKQRIASAAATVVLPATVNGNDIALSATKTTAAGGADDKSICWRGTANGTIEIDGQTFAVDYSVLATIRGSKNWR